MATAKQIAARKLFAQRAKSGAFKRKAKAARKANPAKKRAASKRTRPAASSVAILRPKKTAATRARRRNPITKAETLWPVRQAGSRAVLGYGTSEAGARRLAQTLADKSGKAHEVLRPKK